MTGFREAQRVSRAAAAGVGDGHLRVHGGGGIKWCSAACEEVVGGSGREVRWFSQDGERVERVGSGSVLKMVGARPRGDGRLPPLAVHKTTLLLPTDAEGRRVFLCNLPLALANKIHFTLVHDLRAARL